MKIYFTRKCFIKKFFTKKYLKKIYLKKIYLKKISVVLLGLLIMGTVCAKNIKNNSRIYVEVFTDTAHPVFVGRTYELDVHYYNLDESQKLINQMKTELNQPFRAGLHPSETEMAQRAKSIFINNKVKLKQAYIGLNLAKQYGVKELPAIVFDQGKAVYYGSANLSNAVMRYRSWRSEHKADDINNNDKNDVKNNAKNMG